MPSLNKVLLIGNLVQDPEIRRTPSGIAVSTLRLAVDESFQNKSGERVERAVFLDVDVWDRQAEVCQKYLNKGSPILVEGRLQMDNWTDKESGQKRSRLKVRAERIQFLSRPPREAEASDAPPAAELKGDDAPPKTGNEEDIPF